VAPVNRREFFAMLLAPLALGPLKNLLPTKAAKPAGEVIYQLSGNALWKLSPNPFSYSFYGFTQSAGDVVGSNLIMTSPVFKLSEETVAWAVGKINQMPKELKS
jgi:hypothetical protein